MQPDWYLTTRDNEWCDPIGRAQASLAGGASASGASPSPARDSSERLQQLGSDQQTSLSAPSQSSSSSSLTLSNQHSAGYATRMPANHKAAPAAPGQQQQQQADELQSLASGIKPSAVIKTDEGQQMTSVYVSAVPVNELTQVP